MPSITEKLFGPPQPILPFSALQKPAEKPTLKKVALGAAAVLGAVGAAYYAAKNFNSIDIGKEKSVSLLKSEQEGMAITHRDVNTRAFIDKDLIKDVLLDISPGDKYSQELDPNDYCPSTTPIQISSNAPLPDWLDINAGSTFLGSYNTPGGAVGIQLVGNTAFIAANDKGLQIINVTRPSNPTLIGSYDTPGNAKGIHVLGNLAFVADDTQGLQIINVQTPSTPTLIGSYDTPGSAVQVQVVNNVAFVADSLSGLQIINVTVPNKPSLLGAYDTSGNACGVYVVGNVAYVPDWNGGLNIFNVTVPSRPSLIKNDPSIARAVQVIGRMAFVASDTYGLRILDVTTPSNPTAIGSCDTPGDAVGISVIGNTALIADNNSGLEVIDITRLTNPVLIKTHKTPGSSQQVQGTASIAYVADGLGGLQLIYLLDRLISGTPNVIGSFDLVVSTLCSNGDTLTDKFTITATRFPQTTGARFNDISLLPGNSLQLPFSGKSFFTSKLNSLLSLHAIQTNGAPLPSWLKFEMKPQLIQYFSLNNIAYDLFETKGTVYIATDTAGLTILDATNPESPVLLGQYDTPSYAHAVQVVDNTAFVADWDSGLQIINVTTPSKPTSISSYPTLPYQAAQKVHVVGNTAFLAAGIGGLKIINVGTLKTPTLMGTYDTPGDGSGVQVVGNIAYMTDGNNGLQIINVSVPTAPSLIGTFATPGNAAGLQVVKNTVFIADNNKGLQVIDVTFPNKPVLIGNYSTLGNAFGVQVVGSIAYVAASDKGLEILDITDLKNIKSIGTFLINLSTYSIKISGSTAYLATGDFQNKKGRIDILDLDNWRFSGTPSNSQVGNYNIQLMAKDEYGGSISDTFTIRVEGPPTLKTNLTNQVLKTGLPFTYFIDKKIFQDPNNDTLTYTASRADNSILPSWLNFNPTIPAFLGTPTQADVGTLTLKVNAADSIYPPVSAPFTLNVTHDNRSPQLTNQISLQTASVNKPFKSTFSDTTFSDLDGDKLKYSATLNSGAPLPDWLKFDADSRTFSGTPSPADTDFYADRRLDIVLKADDGKSFAVANFIIAVSGESYPERGIKIGAPILSAATTVLGLYKKRAVLLNSINRKRYHKGTKTAVVGQTFSHVFECNKEKVVKVSMKSLVHKGMKARLYKKMDGSKTCCKREMKKWKPLPCDISNWLNYDDNTAILYSDQTGPSPTDVGLFRVQAFGEAGVLLEQFDLMVSETGEPSQPRPTSAEFGIRAMMAEQNRSSWGGADDMVPLTVVNPQMLETVAEGGAGVDSVREY